MSLELLFLGTGTSAGVPMIGCRCEVCTSGDPRDQRTRPSVLISYRDGDPGALADNDGTARPIRRVLIDTATELRQQMVRHQVERLDAILFTHAHADHIFGLDDVRRFNAVMKAPIDVFAEPDVLDRLRRTFTYIFESHRNINPSFVASLIGHGVEAGEAINLYGARWTGLRLLHGRLPILGYRVDCQGCSIAYCTDVSRIPPETFPLLAELDVLVIDALRYRHHPTHLTVDQALELVEQIAPRQTYLTHIAHDIRHADLTERLPAGVALAYDGLAVAPASIHSRRQATRPSH